MKSLNLPKWIYLLPLIFPLVTILVSFLFKWKNIYLSIAIGIVIFILAQFYIKKSAKDFQARMSEVSQAMADEGKEKTE